MSKTEIELRQAAMWLLQRQLDANFKTEKEASRRLLQAIEASQDTELRELLDPKQRRPE
jgi:hypothetical protein